MLYANMYFYNVPQVITLARKTPSSCPRWTAAQRPVPSATAASRTPRPPPPTTAGWWGEQTPPAQGRGCLFWAYSGVIGQGRDCRYSGIKLVQGQKRVALGGVIAAAHLWADEGHAVPHIEYIVGNLRVRVLRGADGAAQIVKTDVVAEGIVDGFRSLNDRRFPLQISKSQFY